MRSDSADSTSLNLPRRTVLGAGAAVSAGLAAALAAGLGASQPSQSAPAPSGRRRFEGKVVAITGATSGIGRAAAIQFAAEGARSRSAGDVKRLAAKLFSRSRITAARRPTFAPTCATKRSQGLHRPHGRHLWASRCRLQQRRHHSRKAAARIFLQRVGRRDQYESARCFSGDEIRNSATCSQAEAATL